ncbi:hypothetical protein FB45DRAFT_1017293 [Roridomyces roridus]|uniref:DUF6533 domain-containing protein n=1 Tax=Roridomyces roridus TaxID=1738132 RepID=A0AAD7G0P8_9AGAR|nr:hypothetical protein FB45DRAFT_1017293 [Roridomyces roridus]
MATTSPAAAAAQEAALLQLIADSQTTNYLAAAALTLLIIEHISTFKEEIRYVWQSRLSLWSVLYVWTRYLTLISLAVDMMMVPSSHVPTDEGVRAVSFDMPQIPTGGNGYVYHDINERRLYPRSKGLVVIRQGQEVVVLLDSSADSRDGRNDHLWSLYDSSFKRPFLNGCYSLEVPRLFTFFALPYFLMSILMFSMTAYKCGQHMWLRSRRAPMPVITLFLRDGLFLFLAIMLYSTAEIIIWRRARPSLAEIPVVVSQFPAVLGTRILLNIKNLASQSSDRVAPAIELPTLSQQRPSLAPSGGSRVPWYLQTGEVKDEI